MTMAPVQRTWPELIPLLQSGRLDVDGIFTTTLPLDEAAKGYATARARSGEELRSAYALTAVMYWERMKLSIFTSTSGGVSP